MPRILTFAALIAVTVWACWVPSGSSYVYEDVPHATSPSLVAALTTGPSYALTTWSQTWTPTPDGSHRLNLVLHLVNGLLLMTLGLALDFQPWTVLLAVALFWLHPIQNEAVGYVTARSELFEAMGCLLASWALVAPRTVWITLPTLVLGLCVTLAAKPAGLLAWVPLVLWIPFVLTYAWPWVLTVGMALVVWKHAALWAILTTAWSGWDVPSYAAMQTLAFWREAALIIVPRGFTVDHDFDYVGNPIVYASCAGFVVLIALAWWYRHKWGWASFAIVWAVLALAGRFVIPIGEYINEHQWYVPMIGISLGLAAWLTGEPPVERIR
jgi:hypothetical protein